MEFIPKLKKHWKYIALGTLVIANVLIWFVVWQEKPRDYVSVSFLDIGQGDSILIEGRTGKQVLIDGGGNKTILRRLSEELPLFDHSLDALIETHPDKDHIGGFPYILERYSVNQFIEPGVESTNGVDDEIRRIRTKKNISTTLARADTVIDFNDGSYIRVLFPNQDVAGWETNDASIVLEYIYEDTCFLLTGDSPIKIEESLVSIYGNDLHCQVLKAGHHGSRTSTGDTYLEAIKPEIAVISAGKDNSYGHPHRETTERLTKHGVKILSTIDQGTITLYSNGKTISIK